MSKRFLTMVFERGTEGMEVADGVRAVVGLLRVGVALLAGVVALQVAVVVMMFRR